jgi:serine phosphatase RsbU (regulator of sigma subunit)
LIHFRLQAEFERHRLIEGSESVLRADLAELRPPSLWAESLELAGGPSDSPDALLLFLEGEPSSELRYAFFSAFRRGIPIAALTLGPCTGGDPVRAKLASWDACWSYETLAEARKLVQTRVQDWISGIRRESFPFPSGGDLLESYGSIRPDRLTSGPLERARQVLGRRGFVCLSGQLGAGKTTLGRKLLEEASGDGLNPVEIISADVAIDDVERILTGPTDCAVLFDLDIFRRDIGLQSSHFWRLFVSRLVRATEIRRRCILASSVPMLAEIFEDYGDAHIPLPEPTENRMWRLEEGRQALSRFMALDSIRRAELMLLWMFQPVVPEALFRAVLFDYWDRLHLLYENRFLGEGEKERMYRSSRAGRGERPFRRFRLRDESHLAAGDTMTMEAVERGIRKLLSEKSPAVHALADTLLGSGQPRTRRAGFSLTHFLEDLSEENRSNLIYQAAREPAWVNLMDLLPRLLRRSTAFDPAVIGLCRRLSNSDEVTIRRALARSMGSPWVVGSPEYAGVVNRLMSSEPGVRAGLMAGISVWGGDGVQIGVYRRLMADEDRLVRSNVLQFIGSRFPDVSEEELELVNQSLLEGDSYLLMALASGLLVRVPERFSEEFTDLLWVILERLEPAYKSRFTKDIGGRLRYFEPHVRQALLQNLESEDTTAVTMCLLMNYSWLTAEERRMLWELAERRIAADLEYASLVLRYFSAFQRKRRRRLIRTVITAEAWGGREALSQILASGNRELAAESAEVCVETADSGAVEERAKLPWFLLWNRPELGERACELLRRICGDPSGMVREALAGAVLRQGCSDGLALELLEELHTDPERSTRAAVGEAVSANFGEDGATATEVRRALLADPAPFVRARTLRGAAASPHLPLQRRLEIIGSSIEDPDPTVRLEVVEALDASRGLCFGESMAEGLAKLLGDPDEKVRLGAVKMVTDCPEMLASESIRRRLPDLFLDRLTTGETLAEELSTARDIQMELLPDRPPSPASYQVEVFYRPAKEVGGDYYDFFDLPAENLGLAIGDVTGKGIPAALTMASLKGNLGAYVTQVYSISDIMRLVNQRICAGTEGASLMGLFYSVLDLETGRLSYVNAGHNPPLLVRHDGSASRLSTGGLLLGFDPDASYEHGFETMSAGDVLVMYTDGITEAMDADGREFGLQGLTSTVSASRDLSAADIVSSVMKAVGRHSDAAARRDDQTLVVVRHR